MRLIDADASENDWFEFHQPTEEEAAEGCMATFRVLLDRRRIDNAPTIDAVPARRAHWIQEEYWSEGIGMGESYGHYYKCSACGERVKLHDPYLDDYCRKCGAEMYEAKECERKRQEFDDMLAARNKKWRGYL